jgi:putative endonuclease
MQTIGHSPSAGARSASAAADSVDATRRALGRRGEALAERHLRGRGYRTLARNVRTRHGEIDLIVYDRSTIVFVEVKTRRVSACDDAFGESEHPLYGLDARQQARLRRLAAAWLSQRRARPDADRLRFDAIGVAIDTRGRLRRLEHVENAW